MRSMPSLIPSRRKSRNWDDADAVAAVSLTSETESRSTRNGRLMPGLDDQLPEISGPTVTLAAGSRRGLGLCEPNSVSDAWHCEPG